MCEIDDDGAHCLVVSSVYEGSASEDRMCFACWVAYAEFHASHGIVYMPGQMRQTLTECYTEGDEEKGGRWRNHVAGIVRRHRTSTRGRWLLAAKWQQARDRREMVAEAHRRWPGLVRVWTRRTEPGRAYLDVPGIYGYGVEWRGGNEVFLNPRDLGTWMDFDRRRFAGVGAP